jgi:hypothetical protein
MTLNDVESAYFAGVVIGVLGGLAIGFVCFQVPQLWQVHLEKQRARSEADYREEQALQGLEALRATPLRTMQEIQEDRWVPEPITEVAPKPPQLSFTGPPWWRVKDWFLWNLGDFLTNWSFDGWQQQDGRSPRVLRRL